MPARRIRVDPATAMRDGFVAIRREAGVPEDFSAGALEEAARAAERPPVHDERSDLPFITIDPPGSRDLDQAMHIARRGDGHRVSYAIADVGAFVTPGGALDVEVRGRGVTVYAPDTRVPLHPQVLSEGAASLLPGVWRPAVLWTLDLDGSGELVDTHVRRAQVRSVRQCTYADVPDDVAPLLAEVGERRMAIEVARGGVQLDVPEQEVVRHGDGWTTSYRVPLATEDHNAQVSLLCGMAAAQLMLDAGIGILRTQPPPEEKALARLRRQAAALGVAWPAGDGAPAAPAGAAGPASLRAYAAFVRSLDPALPRHAALLQEATTVGRGAGYTAFDGAPPEHHEHFAIAAPYAHATAPLRRLQDRWVSECCLAAGSGTEPPAWVRASLPELPALMAAADRRARSVERGIVDLVEAVLLEPLVGNRFEAVLIDDELVQLKDQSVRGPLRGLSPHPTTKGGQTPDGGGEGGQTPDGGGEGGQTPRVGDEVVVRLVCADPATREIAFEVE